MSLWTKFEGIVLTERQDILEKKFYEFKFELIACVVHIVRQTYARLFYGKFY